MTRLAPLLLALFLAACDEPPPSTRRICAEMGVDPVCVEPSGWRCRAWSCRVQHLEADAGPDAGVDLGVGVDAGRLGLPGNEARGLR